MKYQRLNGARVASLREASGISQAQLAERCEISAPFLCQIENGVRQPSPPVALLIAQKLGVALAEIIEPVEAAS